MTDTITREVAELEELFANELPCGGNHWPVERKCPDGSAATWVSTHICSSDPAAYKCAACYGQWYRAHADAALRGSPYARCYRCGARIHYAELYRPL